MARSPTTPNIILIVVDTARADHLSCYGYARPTTPNIDRIAAEGVLYENAIAPAPWTLPSHASLFTGLYASRHGVHGRHHVLSDRHPTLQGWLAQQGYQTLGISNNSWISASFGFHRGFHTFIQLWQYFQTSTDMAGFKRALEGSNGQRSAGNVWQIFRQGNPLLNVVNGVYGRFFRRRYSGARRTKTELIKWLSTRRLAKQPFYVFINYLEPHLEYKPPRSFDMLHAEDKATARDMLKRDQIRLAWEYIAGVGGVTSEEFHTLRALYDGELSYVDHRIGELCDYLETCGLLDDTLLIITSDHGENIGEHDLMDHQYCLYDTLLRIPLIIRYPRRFPPGIVVDTHVNLVDLFPTIMDVLGAENNPVRAELQGGSLVPDSLRPRPFAVAEYLTPQPSIEALTRKYPAGRAHVLKYDRTLRAIRSEDFKLIVASDGQDELYDLGDDPDELTNVIDRRPGDAVLLRAMLDEWLASFKPSTPDEGLVPDPAILRRLEDLGYL